MPEDEMFYFGPQAWTFSAIGILGYRHAEDYNHFGLNVNNELVSVGFYYTF